MRNLPDGFDIYLVNVKTMRQIAHIFVAFSEKLNFIRQNLILMCLLNVRLRKSDFIQTSELASSCVREINTTLIKVAYSSNFCPLQVLM